MFGKIEKKIRNLLIGSFLVSSILLTCYLQFTFLPNKSISSCIKDIDIINIQNSSFANQTSISIAVNIEIWNRDFFPRIQSTCIWIDLDTDAFMAEYSTESSCAIGLELTSFSKGESYYTQYVYVEVYKNLTALPAGIYIFSANLGTSYKTNFSVSENNYAVSHENLPNEWGNVTDYWFLGFSISLVFSFGFIIAYKRIQKKKM